MILVNMQLKEEDKQKNYNHINRNKKKKKNKMKRMNRKNRFKKMIKTKKIMAIENNINIPFKNSKYMKKLNKIVMVRSLRM